MMHDMALTQDSRKTKNDQHALSKKEHDNKNKNLLSLYGTIATTFPPIQKYLMKKSTFIKSFLLGSLLFTGKGFAVEQHIVPMFNRETTLFSTPPLPKASPVKSTSTVLVIAKT